MKIDIANIIYTVSMIILVFVSSLVVTKTISKYVKKDEVEDKK